MSVFVPPIKSQGIKIRVVASNYDMKIRIDKNKSQLTTEAKNHLATPIQAL